MHKKSTSFKWAATASMLIMGFMSHAQSSFLKDKLLPRLSVNIGVGVSNYGGDLQQKAFTLQQAGFARGIGIAYKLTNQLSIRGDYTFGKIGADDKKGTEAWQTFRNLNFKANLFETALTLQYDLIKEDKYGLVPYVYGGVAYFKASPYTYAPDGTKHYLAGLHTEGQNLDKEVAYSTKHISIPFGFGLRMKLSDRFAASYELGFRKTFTDYIDDVSTNYADYNTLYNYNPLSAQLAFRGNEINKDYTYPSGGIRGNASKKDYYYFGLVKLHFNLTSSERGIGCPKNVY